MPSRSKGEDSMVTANASIKALRALQRDPTIPLRDWVRHIKELTGRNDRLVAIICGSYVEAELRKLLQSAMPNGAGMLFDPHAPLSTFSAKINLAYSLALIGPDIRRNADYMREVRNVFAHRVAPTNFRTKEVSAVYRLLSRGKWDTTFDPKMTMRTKFMLTAIATGGAITNKRLSPEDPSPASLPERRSGVRFLEHPKRHRS